MRLVCVESPFAAANGCSVEDHLDYVRRAMADCLKRGEAPFASHALYTQPGVLDDTIPEQRTLGMEAGFAWAVQAQTTVVYEDYGVSRGMQDGIDRARAEGRPVIFRKIGREG